MAKRVAEPKTKIIRIRMTEREYQEIIARADMSGLTLAEYIRRTASGRKIVSRVGQNAINELRKIGGLLKHVHNESGGAYSEKTAAAIADIRDAVKRIGRPE